MLGLACAIAAVAMGGAGLASADPSLKDQIDSARSNAGELSDQVDSQTSRLASLIEQARQAGARAMELNAEVERADARSQELASQLEAAEKQLERLRGEFAAAVKQLDQRLIAIYESETPDEVAVMLNSDGFDDLSTRSDYLRALHDADVHVAGRVASLRDQMADRTNQIADLKQQS
jgi:peptidoglycan DL-endopeptidase CwlO